MRTTKEDLEEASGRGDREDWFEEGGCSETRQVEGRSARNCRRNGVNPAISAKGKTPDKKLNNYYYYYYYFCLSHLSFILSIIFFVFDQLTIPHAFRTAVATAAPAHLGKLYLSHITAV